MRIYLEPPRSSEGLRCSGQAKAHLLPLLELVGWQVDAVLLARAKQLGLEAVDLLVELFYVGRLADLLVHLRQ